MLARSASRPGPISLPKLTKGQRLDASDLLEPPLPRPLTHGHAKSVAIPFVLCISSGLLLQAVFFFGGALLHGRWLLDVVCCMLYIGWLLAIGYWLLAIGYWLLAIVYYLLLTYCLLSVVYCLLDIEAHLEFFFGHTLIAAVHSNSPRVVVKIPTRCPF
jgi:hypothetical protein